MLFVVQFKQHSNTCTSEVLFCNINCYLGFKYKLKKSQNLITVCSNVVPVSTSLHCVCT